MAYVKDDRVAQIVAQLNLTARATAAKCDEHGFYPGVRDSALWRDLITQLPEYDDELTQRVWREDDPAFDLTDGTRIVFEHGVWSAR